MEFSGTRLVSIDIDATSLDFGFLLWNLPCSRSLVPWIEISGTMGAHASLHQDCRAVEFRCRKLLDLADEGACLVVDARNLAPGLPPLPPLRVEPSLGTLKSLHVLAAHDTAEALSRAFPEARFFTDYGRVLTETAFALKHLRHDGGKQIAEPRMISSLRFDRVSLAISDLSIQTFRVDGVPRDVTVGLVAIAGTYGHGSAGEPDARFIRWRLHEFCEIASPDAIILDLRAFRYEWGDDIFLVPSAFLDRRDRIAAVIDPGGREALSYALADLDHVSADPGEALAIVAPAR